MTSLYQKNESGFTHRKKPGELRKYKQKWKWRIIRGKFQNRMALLNFILYYCWPTVYFKYLFKRRIMVNIFQCSFIRCCLLHVNKNFHSSDTAKKYSHFKEQFSGIITLDEKHFRRKLKDFVVFMRRNKWHGEDREKYMECFTRKKWNLLPVTTKKKHCLHNCLECIMKFSAEQNLFPVAKQTKSVVLTDITNTASNTPEISTSNCIYYQSKIHITDSSIKGMQQSAKSTLDDISKQWNKVYNTPFTKIITKIPGSNLLEKKSSSEKKKHLRQIHQRVKTSIEESWSKEGKDTETLFGDKAVKVTL